MRLLLTVSVAAILSACGGGSANQPASNTEPDIKADKRPSYLLIRSAKSGDAEEMYLNDETTPSSFESIRDAIKEHAAKKDPASGLLGPDKDGISPNLIVFRAPADASSKSFYTVIDLASRYMAYRIHAQLDVAGQEPIELNADLPIDTGAGLAPGPKPVRGTLSTGAGDPVPFAFGIGRSERQQLAGVNLTMAEIAKGGWNPDAYSRVCTALVESLRSFQETSGNWCDEIDILPYTVENPEAKPNYAPWVAVFVAIDAIHRIEPPKGKRKPQLGFKFF
jgi:hypothetical protein